MDGRPESGIVGIPSRPLSTTHRPTFRGTTAPYATVQLYARLLNIDAVLPLGEAVADSNGNWTLQTGPLAAGPYIFTATVTNPGGFPSQEMTLTSPQGGALIYIVPSRKLVRHLSHIRAAVQPAARPLHVTDTRWPRSPGGRHRGMQGG